MNSNPSQPMEPADTQADQQASRLTRFMNNAKPSSRQLEELQALGYSGVLITSMLEASELIAELTSRNGGR